MEAQAEVGHPGDIGVGRRRAAAQPDSPRASALTATPNGTATRSPAGPGSRSSASAPASGTASSAGEQGPGHVKTTTPAISSSTPASSPVRYAVTSPRLGAGHQAGQQPRRTTGAEHAGDHDVVVGPAHGPGGDPHRADDPAGVDRVEVERVHQRRPGRQHPQRVGRAVLPPAGQDRAGSRRGRAAPTPPTSRRPARGRRPARPDQSASQAGRSPTSPSTSAGTASTTSGPLIASDDSWAATPPRGWPKKVSSQSRVAYAAVTATVSRPTTSTSQPAHAADRPVVQGGLLGRAEHRLLGEEPGERRDPGQRGQPDGHRREGHRHQSPQPAHVRHQVGADGVDDRAGGEEQQRLEGRVGQQVEAGRGRRAPTASAAEHVGELARPSSRRAPA